MVRGGAKEKREKLDRWKLQWLNEMEAGNGEQDGTVGKKDCL